MRPVKNVPAGLYPIRGVMSVCHLLVEGEDAWLIDTGLPGHSEGHCGFYSPRHDLLFSGDLFASYFFNIHLPAPILNSRPELIPGSLRKTLRLDPRWILPNHYDVCDGALYKRRFVELCRKRLSRPLALSPQG